MKHFHWIFVFLAAGTIFIWAGMNPMIPDLLRVAFFGIAAAALWSAVVKAVHHFDSMPPWILITVDFIMEQGPCRKYPRRRVQKLIGAGRTAKEVLDLRIPKDDRVWVLTRHGVLSEEQLNLLVSHAEAESRYYSEFLRCYACLFELPLSRFREVIEGAKQ